MLHDYIEDAETNEPSSDHKIATRSHPVPRHLVIAKDLANKVVAIHGQIPRSDGMQDNSLVTPPDILASPRDELVRSHIIHEFDVDRVKANLAGCYGSVMNRVYRHVLSLVRGRRILDSGCGFGQFARVALDAGYEVHPIDIDESSLVIARDVLHVPVRLESAYATSLPDDGSDTCVCCDSIQHLDVKHLASEIKRLGVKRLIIYDSNPANPLLERYRKIVGHEENNERSVLEIEAAFRDQGFQQVMLSYQNFLTLPVSGGFQRKPIAVLSNFPRALYLIDRFFERVLPSPLSRVFAFRFLMVLDRSSS